MKYFDLKKENVVNFLSKKQSLLKFAFLLLDSNYFSSVSTHLKDSNLRRLQQFCLLISTDLSLVNCVWNHIGNLRFLFFKCLFHGIQILNLLENVDVTQVQAHPHCLRIYPLHHLLLHSHEWMRESVLAAARWFGFLNMIPNVWCWTRCRLDCDRYLFDAAKGNNQSEIHFNKESFFALFFPEFIQLFRFY